MKKDVTLMTREQYIEMLIDASFQDASEMESGFASWCKKHVPIWQERGFDELWIRQRIEMAQITRGLHCHLKEKGLTMLEIREELRKTYADDPELYNRARDYHPDLLRYRGNAGDLRQRYTLRVMVYETDKLAYEKFCRWSRQIDPDLVFFEHPDSIRVIRDLSTVEELDLALAMCRYMLQLFDKLENLTNDQIASRMEAYGKQLRTTFITRYGYLPEESTTPYVPVTIEGPQDHNAYYAKEYPEQKN